MQETIHWYESAQTLTNILPVILGNELFQTIQVGEAPKLQTLVARWHCVIELLAVNLVSNLPRPFGAFLRKLVYRFFFAHTGKGLHVRANPTLSVTAMGNDRLNVNANRWLVTESKVNTAQAAAPRSLYENCLRGCLKSDAI